MTGNVGESVQTAPRWIDVFPWIEAAARQVYAAAGRRAWWLEPIDALGTVGRAQRLTELSFLAVQQLRDWSVGQVFPHLPPGTVLGQLPLPVRAKIAFRRHKVYAAADLMNDTVGVLLSWSWVGTETVESILRALASASIGETARVPVGNGFEDMPAAGRRHEVGAEAEPSGDEPSSVGDSNGSTRRWLDVFPWIESAARVSAVIDEREPWWREPIESAGSDERDRRLAQLSDLALELLASWPIGLIFPRLSPETVLGQLPVTPQARTAFRRSDVLVASDLMHQELGDILEWPQIGIGAVDSILRALADASISERAWVPEGDGQEEVATGAGREETEPEPRGDAPPLKTSGSAVRWLDVFPWIESAASVSAVIDERDSWWREPIHSAGSDDPDRRLAQLTELARELLVHWPIGQIFPRLSPETDLDELLVTTRARNAFNRFGVRVAGDLMRQKLGDILDWPQVGVGTVDSILRALASVSLPSAAEHHQMAATRETPEDAALPRAGGGDAVLPYADDLRLVARWYVAIGMPAHALLSELPPGSPPDVVKAKQRLEAMIPGDVLEVGQDELDACTILGFCIDALDARTQDILARRFFADRPETLDDLGRTLGITRERIRQIEAKARADMMVFLEPGGDLEMVAATVRQLIGNVLPLDELIARVPALGRVVPAVDQPAWRVLDRLDDAYEIVDGWCASPTIRGAQEATLTRLQELANDHGIVRIDDVEALNPCQTGDDARRSLRGWLNYCGCELDGDFVFTRTQSISDRAASVLSIIGSPMTSQEILDRLGVGRSSASLKNAMNADDRFVRVDRDRWGLAEWGLESYTGVRELVRGEVARGGGQVPMDDLVDRITRMYTVSANSVIAYASSPPFEAKNGIVRMASTGRQARKSPQRTKRLYKRGSEWLFRIRITKDHLRGSGFTAPVAIATILDLPQGTSRQLRSALGPQNVNWTGNQPAFGSIRRFLVYEDAPIGAEVFLVMGGGKFRIEPVDMRYSDPLDQALALVGAIDSESRRSPRAALARAIELPDDSPAASVIGGFRERGDEDIADLLLSVKDQLGDRSESRPAPSADINEILDLL